MKQTVETLLRIILLVVILYTTSFGAFAGGKKKAVHKTKHNNKQAMATAPVNPALAPTASATDQQPQNSVTPNGPQLTPRQKKKHRIAIVPAPPPPGPDNQVPRNIPR